MTFIMKLEAESTKFKEVIGVEQIHNTKIEFFNKK